jgi:RimJ/RimL family protein N-acetyltransferase
MIYLVNCDDAVGAWVYSKLGCRWLQGLGVAFGVADDYGIACGLTFSDWNGPNVYVGVAVDRPTGFKWLLESGMKYAFGQLGCTRLTFMTESSNIKSVRLQERLGAVREATLTGAGRNGDDILISRLTPDNYIWRRLNGIERRRQRTYTPGLRESDSPAGKVQHEPVWFNAELEQGGFDNSVRDNDLATAGYAGRDLAGQPAA